MLSLQVSPSMEKKKKKKTKLGSFTEKNSTLKRRKREAETEEEVPLKKDLKLCYNPQLPKLDSFIELNLDTPLPFEWQRCLDIKSGEIHFYNTMTHMRTFKDPRRIPRPALNLELNLTCEPSEIHAVEGDRTYDVGEKEMVAAVCARCHMLVMMWKASPSCPNCRFEHPPALQSSPASEKKAKDDAFILQGLRAWV